MNVEKIGENVKQHQSSNSIFEVALVINFSPVASIRSKEIYLYILLSKRLMRYR
jgi:hypothetical protein